MDWLKFLHIFSLHFSAPFLPLDLWNVLWCICVTGKCVCVCVRVLCSVCVCVCACVLCSVCVCSCMHVLYMSVYLTTKL